MTTTEPSGQPPDELARLREAWPEFSIGKIWTSRASGPDVCRWVAVKGTVIVSAWSAAELEIALRRESGES